MKKKQKFAIIAILSIVFLAGGIIYATEFVIPEIDPRGCFTNDNNDGHCVHNGNSYFCADKQWYQRKNCQKAGKIKIDEGGIEPSH